VETSEQADPKWSEAPPLQEMPLNSAICLPRSGSTCKRDKNGTVEVKGYALPGYAAGPIQKVEVSADGGNTWEKAKLSENDGQDDGDLKWAWHRWEIRMPMEAGENQKLLSRATDSTGDRQEAQSQWNLRGIGYCGYGEVSDLTIV
jgi:sulfite oxidase